jgi:hypothetical protein
MASLKNALIKRAESVNPLKMSEESQSSSEEDWDSDE